MSLSRSLADLRIINWSAIIKQGFWIPRPAWTVDDIPDLTGKVVIVTGANSGIGKETAKVSPATFRLLYSRADCVLQALLTHNAKVYLACRAAERAQQAIMDLEEATGKKAVFLPLDSSSLKSVKEAATEFLR